MGTSSLCLSLKEVTYLKEVYTLFIGQGEWGQNNYAPVTLTQYLPPLPLRMSRHVYSLVTPHPVFPSTVLRSIRPQKVYPSFFQPKPNLKPPKRVEVRRQENRETRETPSPFNTPPRLSV